MIKPPHSANGIGFGVSEDVCVDIWPNGYQHPVYTDGNNKSSDKSMPRCFTIWYGATWSEFRLLIESVGYIGFDSHMGPIMFSIVSCRLKKSFYSMIVDEEPFDLLVVVIIKTADVSFFVDKNEFLAMQDVGRIRF